MEDLPYYTHFRKQYAEARCAFFTAQTAALAQCSEAIDLTAYYAACIHDMCLKGPVDSATPMCVLAREVASECYSYGLTVDLSSDLEYNDYCGNILYNISTHQTKKHTHALESRPYERVCIFKIC